MHDAPFQVVVTYEQTVTYLRTDRDVYDIDEFIEKLETLLLGCVTQALFDPEGNTTDEVCAGDVTITVAEDFG